MITSGS